MPGSLLWWEILEFVTLVGLLYREARYNRRFFILEVFRCSYSESFVIKFWRVVSPGALLYKEAS